MSLYDHLTILEREEIAKCRAQGYSIRGIARKLKRSPSTISREINRNAFEPEQYSPIIAQRLYFLKRKNCGRKKILSDSYLKHTIKRLFLEEQWSPEEIAFRLKREEYPISISYTTIYRAIHAAEFDEGKLKQGHRGVVKKLRRKGKRYSRKNEEETRGKIVATHTIHDRPLEAEKRAVLGHWEADTMTGKTGESCLLTLTDRKSRFLQVSKVQSKKAEFVTEQLIHLLRKFPSEKRISITPDRGKEFAFHKEITEKLSGMPVYFADPQAPWQRGTNENTNGLLREYFPKHQSLEELTNQSLEKVVKKINQRPRKCLEWKTPHEVFFDEVLHLI